MRIYVKRQGLSSSSSYIFEIPESADNLLDRWLNRMKIMVYHDYEGRVPDATDPSRFALSRYLYGGHGEEIQ
jgi:hypothetical protein